MARADFEIVDQKPIGRGQFGTVFRARRRSDGRVTALKLILQRDNPVETIDAERRGATLQQRFAEQHGMVPEVFEFGPDDDDFFIAMELVEGPSLEERLRGGALPCAEAVGHALWLCEFLAEAHAFSPIVEGQAYRLLHNDLKPAHLKIPEQGERKVLDFGIAKALEETRELATDVGRTIAYAAPERLLYERVNVHADFWSLGVMLYEMAAGHRPYPDLEGPRHRRSLYTAITTNTPRAALPRECPTHLQAIINRLLAFQPEHRYQSAIEIRADLDRFAKGDVPAAAAYYETPATLPVSRKASTITPPTDIRPTAASSSPPPSLAAVPLAATNGANLSALATPLGPDAASLAGPSNQSLAASNAPSPAAVAAPLAPGASSLAVSNAANLSAASTPLAGSSPSSPSSTPTTMGTGTRMTFPGAASSVASPPAAGSGATSAASGPSRPAGGATPFAASNAANGFHVAGVTPLSAAGPAIAAAPLAVAGVTAAGAAALAGVPGAVAISATPPLAVIPTVPATDPVPLATLPVPAVAAGAAGSGAGVVVSAGAARAARKAVPPRTITRRFTTAMATLMLLSITSTEGVAWLSAEHFRSTIPEIDERTVISSHEAYDAVARWSLFDLGLRLRVDRPLASALRTIGDRVIADYRRETPTMGAEEWRQAQAAFGWARSLAPGDPSLRAKELIAEGHVRRIAAQKARSTSSATGNAQAAVGRFRDAASADPESPDPYIGMAVPLVYTLGDVDGALAALDEATKRGYTQTRREKALIGDAYMRRATTILKRASELTGDERHSTLVAARDDFEHCVASFAQIVSFGKATENLNACKSQMRKINQQLDEEGGNGFWSFLWRSDKS